MTDLSPGDGLPRLLTAREAAERLRISERSLWTLSAPRGALLAVRLGNSVRYDSGDVLAFLEAAKNILPVTRPRRGKQLGGGGKAAQV